MKKSSLLKQYIQSPDILVIPGVPDPLCAKIAALEGFQAVFVSGYACSATHLGAPDVGLLTMSEMVDCARRIVDAIDLPVFADGDTGHGNLTNVARTMHDFENAGVAAIFFEDQVAPKRCGHMTGKQVITAPEMVSKIKSAVDARRDTDLQIMARTDALAVEGLDRAIERMHLYLEAGADLAFVEAPATVDQMRRIVKEIPAANMANMVPGGRSPRLTAMELEQIGFAVAAHPTALLYTVGRAAQMLLRELRSTGTTAAAESVMMQFEEFNRLTGLDRIREREQRLVSPECEAVADSVAQDNCQPETRQ